MIRMGHSNRLNVRTGLLAGLIALATSASVHAITVISTHTLQNGGALTVDPPLLVISGGTGPMLTMLSGATAEWEGAAILGWQAGEAGGLQLLNGTVRTTGDGFFYEGVWHDGGAGYLGYSSGSVGTALVTGANSKWEMEGNLRIGHYGYGELVIAAGATVSAGNTLVGAHAGSEGLAAVNGADARLDISELLFVGMEGTGELRVFNSAGVSSGNAYIGYLYDVTGTALVSGAGSTWTNGGELLVGFLGSGELNIVDGGSMSTGSAALGLAGGTGTINVTGPESTFTVNGLMAVGHGSAGTLNITDGASVTSDVGVIGSGGSLSFGTVTVGGADSSWTTNNLILGGQAINLPSNGNGTLTIQDGGTVTVAGITRVHNANSTIQLQTGGTLQTHDLDLTGGGKLDWTGGTLIAFGDIKTDLTVPEAGTLISTGIIHGDTVNAGIISPGTSPGRIMINGDYTQESTGSLLIELGGLTAGCDYDQLWVLGDATLGGTLSVQLLDGFQLDVGQQFKIVTVNGMLGASTFAGLGQDALVGTFNGVDLFIRYRYDAAPGVLLYTIPEPSTVVLLALAATSLLRRHRRPRAAEL
ncbi:MAG TPA: PEP-CTERM sorting domain-containing protein [Phycisphaerae bacterium]|nr:PEP-CTERM sorting domain-containing protein [Phycisphaerae bacterium]HOM52058.1 PEP-CTERM sorting domain-containing protein [Phycisphaerae bacterium]HPU25794.1 PEP-CTERM sorting domain-containing protein [Phycisphaerae bacterium]